MTDPESRYSATETVTHRDADGRETVYFRRRFPPRPERLGVLADVTVSDADRLDLIAARTLGAPEAFWRICDREAALRPADLTETPGRTLRVPMPGPVGEHER